MNLDLPRHVKKPGQWKRVETQAELDAALADGWVLRLPSPGDEPPAEPVAAVDPDPEPAGNEADAVPVERSDDPPKPRGRRKKSDA